MGRGGRVDGRVTERRGKEGGRERGSFRVIPFHSHSKLKARRPRSKGLLHATLLLRLTLPCFLGFEVIANLEETLAEIITTRLLVTATNNRTFMPHSQQLLLRDISG